MDIVKVWNKTTSFKLAEVGLINEILKHDQLTMKTALDMDDVFSTLKWMMMNTKCCVMVVSGFQM